MQSLAKVVDDKFKFILGSVNKARGTETIIKCETRSKIIFNLFIIFKSAGLPMHWDAFAP